MPSLDRGLSRCCEDPELVQGAGETLRELLTMEQICSASNQSLARRQWRCLSSCADITRHEEWLAWRLLFWNVVGHRVCEGSSWSRPHRPSQSSCCPFGNP